jgi:hypothetical protein
MLPQHRGGTRFFTRGDILKFSFRYKVIGIDKNRDTKSESRRQPGRPAKPLRGWLYSIMQLAGKAIAYTDLLAFCAFSKAILIILKESNT